MADGQFEDVPSAHVAAAFEDAPSAHTNASLTFEAPGP